MIESACLCVGEVYISTVCSIPPLRTSSAESLHSSNVTRMVTLQTGKRHKRVHTQQNPTSCSKKRAMSLQKAGMCVCVWCTYISTVCSIPPLLTSSTDSTDSPKSDDAILSENVSGELVNLISLWKDVSMKSLSFYVDHPRHLMLFRMHISRRAAGNGRAVLEGVGLDAPTIAACFTAHPLNEEGAVQEGLTRWCGGEGFQPPTWRILVEAIEYAHIAQQDIEALKRALS